MAATKAKYLMSLKLSWRFLKRSFSSFSSFSVLNDQRFELEYLANRADKLEQLNE
ncbi:hypothetical protein [Paenibacillus terrae]|uniref:hypothetical protein n=1 Tax=Paenibacillus terrae TaxID=159743 RepID=UPI000AF85028|nr:hypothetical protein [Paenibacillus terrae]